jgi:hypothetical protein|tara:strand:+ start:1242 stop:1376 length:135 start_codon:yes stop_codon:yes gene_type:complete
MPDRDSMTGDRIGSAGLRLLLTDKLKMGRMVASLATIQAWPPEL